MYVPIEDESLEQPEEKGLRTKGKAEIEKATSGTVRVARARYLVSGPFCAPVRLMARDGAGGEAAAFLRLWPASLGRPVGAVTSSTSLFATAGEAT